MSLDRLFKLAAYFEGKLEKVSQQKPLQPLQPLKPNQPTVSYKDKLMAALKPEVKSAIETLNVDMTTSTIKVKFHTGAMFKEQLLKSLTETAKQTLPGSFTVKEVGYLGY